MLSNGRNTGTKMIGSAQCTLALKDTMTACNRPCAVLSSISDVAHTVAH